MFIPALHVCNRSYNWVLEVGNGLVGFSWCEHGPTEIYLGTDRVDVPASPHAIAGSVAAILLIGFFLVAAVRRSWRLRDSRRV